MFYKKVTVAYLLSFLLFSAASASIIDRGYYTTSTETNLDWLDVTLTTNMSYNTVNALIGDGSNDLLLNGINYGNGWRYADWSQFNNLLEDFGFTHDLLPYIPWVSNFAGTSLERPTYCEGSTCFAISGVIGSTSPTERQIISIWPTGYMGSRINASDAGFAAALADAGYTSDIVNLLSPADVVEGSWCKANLCLKSPKLIGNDGQDISDVISILGDTYEQSVRGKWDGLDIIAGNGATYGMILDARIRYISDFDTTFDGVRSDRSDEISYQPTPTNDHERASLGSFLIRDTIYIDEPTSIFLFSLGIVALLISRKKYCS